MKCIHSTHSKLSIYLLSTKNHLDIRYLHLHYLAAHEVDNNYFWWSGSVCVSVLSTVISYSLSNVENITFVQFRIYDISLFAYYTAWIVICINIKCQKCYMEYFIRPSIQCPLTFQSVSLEDAILNDLFFFVLRRRRVPRTDVSI